MKDYLEELLERFSKQSFPFKSATLFVRDIPYGDIGSRDPKDIIRTNMGTCSGKHFLLKEIYLSLGFEVKDMIAIHKFNDLNIELSKNLKSLLLQGEVYDPHNFLAVNLDGKWYKVDITWDRPLGKIGLEINEGWDGKSDMNICVVAKEIIEVEDGLQFKKDYIGKLDPKAQKLRREFIQEFGKYLTTIR